MREHLLTQLKRFKKDENGVTAIEYGLIAALVAVAIVGATRALGTQLSATFNAVSAAMQAA